MIFRVVCFAAIALGGVAAGAIYFRQTQLADGHQAFQNANYPLAFRKLSTFSGWWDAQAEAELGVIYGNGFGVPKDNATAFILFQKSAAAGFPHGEYLLSKAYALGLSGKVDEEKAMIWLRQAANADDQLAEEELGERLFNGLGVPKNDIEAASWFTKSANHGSATGAANLGILYSNGDGVPQDYRLADVWLQKAAAQNNAVAQRRLGELFRSGEGRKQDDVQAAIWFRKAADQGDANSQLDLANFYFNGTGVPQDYAQSFKLYKAAAEQEQDEAEYNLGVSYLKGLATPVDISTSLRWFKASAQQGNSDGQDALGRFYADEGFDYGLPLGLPHSRVLAYAYFGLAAAQGNTNSKRAKEDLEKIMTPEQVKSAQAIASGWQKDKPLPAETTFEDQAPQELFSYKHLPDDIYKNTRIWFSRSFESNGEKEYAVFLVTRNEPIHVNSASISVVTFNISNTSNSSFNGHDQLDFTQMGSFGDVPALADANAPYASAERIKTQMIKLSNGGAELLVPDAYSGMGTTQSFYKVLGFNSGEQPNFRWVDLGELIVAEENSQECEIDKTADVNGYHHPCYSWTGTVNALPRQGGTLPDLVVSSNEPIKIEGQLQKSNKLIYRFDGKKYVSASSNP